MADIAPGAFAQQRFEKGEHSSERPLADVSSRLLAVKKQVLALRAELKSAKTALPEEQEKLLLLPSPLPLPRRFLKETELGKLHREASRQAD